MNKKDIALSKNHKLFIIGSARGVNRFYVTNKFIEKYPNAKVINTGVLINTLAKNINIGILDNLSIKNYCKILEPVFIENILAHLEHTDVILDTHFYHLMPCISIKGLQSIIDRISGVILVLVNDDSLEVYKEKRNRGNEWFDSLDNIKYDISSNEIYFDFYKMFFIKHVSQDSLSFNIRTDNIKIVEDFISKISGK